MSSANLRPAYTRSWAANSVNARVRLAAENSRLKEQVLLLQEELRIKDVRMGQIPPHHRPQYPPTERMAILELKAAHAWSLEQTAKAFLVTATTIASRMKRLDEDGPDALVQLPAPVNKFPDFTCYVVQRLKTLCPTMGKAKIAETLALAGLHLGTTTMSRILKEKPHPPTPFVVTEAAGRNRTITAKYASHVWHIDLTVVPTGAGFWTAWLPLSLPRCWPFCWWVGGKTPDEAYHGHHSANRKPRFRGSLALASRFAFCQALGVGARQPQCEADTRSQFSRREKTPAHRATETRRMSSEVINFTMIALRLCALAAPRNAFFSPIFIEPFFTQHVLTLRNPQLASLVSLSIRLTWGTSLFLVGCQDSLV